MRFKIKKTAAVLFSLLVPAYVIASVNDAFAFNVGTTSSLPWETPLSTLSAELTGPTASAIAIIAIFVSGLGLIFGEDLGKFARSLLMIVIAISLLIGAAKFVPIFATSAGAF